MNRLPAILRTLCWALVAICVPAVSASQRPTDSAQVARIDRIQQIIDSMAERPGARVVRVAWLEDSTFYRLTGKDDWPENTATSFGFFQDQGKVRMSWEVPSSRSGDWSERIVYWFDRAGATLLVERRYSRFTLCLDESEESVNGTETTRSYYDATHHLIRQSFTRIGGEGGAKDLSALTNCVHSDTSDYVRYPTWDSMATATGLARFLQGR